MSVLIVLLAFLVLLFVALLERDAPSSPRRVVARAARVAACACVCSFAFLGCTTSERCAAARGASLACRVLSAVAERTCTAGGDVPIGGVEPDPWGELSDDERRAALSAMTEAAALLRRREGVSP